jgi:hypothetical protein
MAKFGEGDGRWIVKDRADGANVNNWHWTTKNVTSHVTEQLNEGVKGEIFPSDGILADCRIKSAETSGEASVNNRKGRTFLIYELEMKLKWEGELRDTEGKVLEKGSGSFKLPDVSAESLDDLEIEFETKSRGSALSEAMRTQGARCVRASVQTTVKRLQAEVTASAAAEKPPAASLPAQSANNVPPPPRPIPQPIKIEQAAGPAPKPQPVSSSGDAPSSKRAVDISDEYDDEEAPPPGLAAALKKLKADPAGTKVLRLSNLSIEDVHLKPLITALQSSQVTLEELDLSFNRLTDAGVHVLLKAFAGGLVLELSKLFLGGNKVSPAGMAMSQGLKQTRPDLLVNWMQQLPNGKSMCTVGTVYPKSPAESAGLRQGDSVVAFGPVQHEVYQGVSESIVPVVKKHVDKPIDVVVVRMNHDKMSVDQIALTLTPKKWSGAGLLGCILK